MNIKTIAVAALALFSFGCANIGTLSRTTILPPQKDEPVTDTKPQSNKVNHSSTNANGLAIHLDAPQRLVFSKDGVVCAEPSPDALQVYAASQGLSFLTPSDVSVQLANAFSGNAASIGLRTQSITLMREILYRICEASYGKKITDFDVAQLMRRSQDLTLGVLAIEQLSGAVKAQQVGISTKSNADASGNLRATRSNLAAARDEELLAETALTNAKKKKEDQDTLVASMDTAYKNLADSDASKPEASAKLKVEQDKAVAYEKDLQAKKKNYDEAQGVTKKIEENLGKALLTAKAAVEGEIQFSEEGGSIGNTKLNDSSAKNISDAATLIVDKIINKDHTVDSCISLLNKFAYSELNPSAHQSYEQKLEAQIELKELEKEKEKVTNEKNEIELRKVKAETEAAVLELNKTPNEASVRARQKAKELNTQVGQQQERRQDIDQKIIRLKGASLIREQCVGIIQNHLGKKEQEKKEQDKEELSGK